MIPRHQRIVFWCLVLAIVAMGGWLFHVHLRERDRLHALGDDTTVDTTAPDAAPVTFDLPNDADGSITATVRQVALPDEATARARAVIDRLVQIENEPNATHPLPPGPAVNSVFLVPLPVTGHAFDPNARTTDGTTPTAPVAAAPDATQPVTPGGQLAVIDLRGPFVNAHPSGVETETLTIASILGTLHANVPTIEQVRFLVDGQPRETLAGHADLLKTYTVRDTATR